MNYPFWDTGVGYGLLMALISVIHVFISHFAIGGGLYLVVNEMLARRRDDQRTLDYLEGLTKFFVLVTLVLGAITGVGIWFIIGLLNPAATEALIHHFVWAWATEWTFFFVEITAAILYYYGWRRMAGRDHVTLGWIYFAAAWLSLFVINGIITFMLTPGAWLATGNVWDGLFNPTFWPSLVYRTGVTVLLAGLYTTLVASRLPADDFKARLVRTNALWGLAGLALMAPSFYWYWASIPEKLMKKAAIAMRVPMESVTQSYYLAALLVVLLLAAGFVVGRRMRPVAAVVVLAVGFLYFGSFEMFRESLRKPYVIGGYMYGNALEVARSDQYKREGLLANIAYRTGDDGADLFRHACRSCHTLSGYRPLRRTFDGTDAAFIQGLIEGTKVIKGNMPPFLGTPAEAAAIAQTIHRRIDNRHLADIYALQGAALGEKVYEKRCGRCHEIGGYRDNSDFIVGLEREDYEDLLDEADDYGDEMPAFTGDERERKSLIEYFLSLEEK